MNKKQIISKIVNDLPTEDMRGKMTKEEWYGWFEECWDKAINYSQCCKSDSEQLCEVCNNDQVFETEDGFIADCPRCN